MSSKANWLTRFLHLCLSMMCLFGVSGCSYWRNATFDPAFQGGYRYGDVYVTQKEMLLDRHFRRITPYAISSLESRVESFKEKGAAGLNKDAVGILPEGTSLKVSKIWFYYNFDHGNWYVPTAEILDEPYKGYQVSLEYISKDLMNQGKRSKRWYLGKYDFYVEDGDQACIKKSGAQ